MPTYIRVKDLPNAATSPASDDFILLSGTANGARKIGRADFLSAVAGFYTANPSTYKLATLDAGDKVLVSQLPSAAFSYKGTWAASSNTPSLANGTGTAGDTYYASDSGSVNFGAGSIAFLAGDAVVYDGSVWQKVPDVVNLLDGKGTLDEAKTTLEIPDVGTAPNETPLNQHLGSLAYQSAESVSVDTLEVTDKIGVGTNSGSRELTIGDGTGSPNIQLLSSNSGLARIEFGDTDDGDAGELMYDHSNNKLTVNTAGSTAVTIDSSQRVGIGNTSPGSYANGGADDLVIGDATGSRGITISTGSAETGSLYFGDDVASGAPSYRGMVRYVHTTNQLQFATQSSIRWHISSSGDLVSSGGGIDFGSGASTTLDDYEEGVHTATVFPNTSGSISLAASYDSFAYTKIGRSITVTGWLQIGSVSSPVGTSIVFTLPTTTLNLSDFSGAIGGAVAYHDSSTGIWSAVSCATGESTNQLYVHIDPSTVAVNDQFRISICYQSA